MSGRGGNPAGTSAQALQGVPQDVVNFFYLIAEEVRSILAKLGYRSLDEIIGRADLLQYRQSASLAKTSSLNLDCILQLPDVKLNRDWLNHGPAHSNGHVLDDDILADAQIQNAIENHGTVTKHIKIVNTDRSVGARIAGVIARKYGDTGFQGHLVLHFKGTAGQSFGAFNIQGVHLYLEGEANDYVGKGMSGGEIVIVPPLKLP